MDNHHHNSSQVGTHASARSRREVKPGFSTVIFPRSPALFATALASKGKTAEMRGTNLLLRADHRLPARHDLPAFRNEPA